MCPRPGDVTEATPVGVSVFAPAVYVVQRVTADRVWYIDLCDRRVELMDVELVEWRHFAEHDRVVYIAEHDDELVGRIARGAPHLRVLDGGRR
jgi:hypothetical protein